MDTLNPYDWQSHNPQVQVPRPHLERVAETLANGGSAVVLGGRGMGKTALALLRNWPPAGPAVCRSPLGVPKGGTLRVGRRQSGPRDASTRPSPDCDAFSTRATTRWATWLADRGETADARAPLDQGLKILRARLPPEDWRIVEAQALADALGVTAGTRVPPSAAPEP